MIARSNTQPSPEVVDDCPDGCWDLQLGIKSSETAQDGNNQNQRRIDPIDMLMPITQCNRLLADMQPLRIWLSLARRGFAFRQHDGCGGG